MAGNRLRHNRQPQARSGQNAGLRRSVKALEYLLPLRFRNAGALVIHPKPNHPILGRTQSYPHHVIGLGPLRRIIEHIEHSPVKGKWVTIEQPASNLGTDFDINPAPSRPL